MPDPDPNLAAPVRVRLLNRARATGRPFDILLTQFIHERLLYRLSVSPYADRFALKGAMLLATWLPDTARGTRNLDLLGFEEASESRILDIFREVLAYSAEDGVGFDPGVLRAEPIREGLKYGGLRLRAVSTLSGARIAVVVDIGFDDSVEPGLERIEYPSLLGLPAPKLRAYALAPAFAGDPLIRAATRQPGTIDRRAIVNAIFDQLRTGCQWRYWPRNGVWDQVLGALQPAVRQG